MQAFQNLLDHLVTHHLGLLKSRLEELLRHNKPLLPRLKVAQADTLRPAPRRKRKLQVIAPVRLVLDGREDRRVQHIRVAEEVLGHAQTQAEQGRAAEHVVVGHDVQRRPAVDHGEQGEVVVRAGLGVGGRAEGEGGEDGGLEERAGVPGCGGPEDLVAGGVDAGPEAFEVALEHEFVEVCYASRILCDLLPRLGVKNCQAGVDMPLLTVDAQHQIDLDILNPTHITGKFPGELSVRMPRLAHGEKGSVGDGLGISRDAIVLEGRQVDKLGAET